MLTVNIPVARPDKKPLIQEKDKIEKEAVVELDKAMEAPEGFFYLLSQENNIKGQYTFDITIANKGEVSSVYAAENFGGTIDSQNKLKDALKYDWAFGFKVPKNHRYKIRYVFTFE